MSIFSKMQSLDDVVNYGYNSDYSTIKCSTVRRAKDMILMDQLIYDRYRDLLYENSVVTQLTLEGQKKYLYRPDLLAYDIYGNPSLDHMILYLNNCSESEFRPTIVRYLKPDAVEDVLKIIISKETSTITQSKKNAMG